MIDRQLARGIFLVGFALIFGLTSLTYGLGTLQRPGPGMFPGMVSALLGVVGLVTIAGARFAKEREALSFAPRNIVLVLGSLVGFTLISKYLNMIAAIVFLVFVVTLAGTNYSLSRNVKVALGLIAVAFALSRFLGLRLPLY